MANPWLVGTLYIPVREIHGILVTRSPLLNHLMFLSDTDRTGASEPARERYAGNEELQNGPSHNEDIERNV